MTQLKSIAVLLTCLFLIACGEKKNKEKDPKNMEWAEVKDQANGQSINMMMWLGDAQIKKYMQDYIIPRVKNKYGIDMELVAGQGSEVVQKLMLESQVGKSSDIDMMWINGETFYQLREINALYGPWTHQLPNAQYVDWENPFIGVDFQQPIEGYELPWGNVQMTLIYDNDKVNAPPQTREELYNYVRKNPGIFTWDNQFTGLTFLKALLIDIAGGGEELEGDFNEKKYSRYSKELWSYVNRIKPYLWRGGEVFPSGVAQMHQLFANGELWFTMSNNDSEVDSKTAEGLFPESARAYVPSFGTIQNSHYLGIPAMSGNKAAAMVVANEMISPEAQLEKMKPSVWGDGTVLDLNSLSRKRKQQFLNLPGRKQAPKREQIQQKALRELAPEYMIRLAEDFRKKVIEN